MDRASPFFRTRVWAACSAFLHPPNSSRGDFECSSNNNFLARIVLTGDKLISIEFNLNIEKFQIEFNARTRKASPFLRTKIRAVCAASVPPLPSSRGDFECSCDHRSLAIIVFTGNKLI